MTIIEDARQWNVVTAGPSRAFLKASDLLPGAPTVTVNRAIDIIDRGITVDFAAFADPPMHLVKPLGLERFLVPPIQVWCPRSALYMDRGVLTVHDMVAQWEPFLGASVGIRTMPFGTVDAAGGVKRYMFAMLAVMERVMMFRPRLVRILCADMMGSWAQGMTEEECEMHQSVMEQAKRQISTAQKRVNETKGQDASAKIQLEEGQKQLAELTARGDPGVFKRWEHERTQLKELEKRANAVGATFEYMTPKDTILA